jgi:DNA-binding protein H-NS
MTDSVAAPEAPIASPPAAPVAPAPVSSPESDYHPSQDDQAGLAVLRAAKAAARAEVAPVAEPTAPPAEPPPKSMPSPEAPSPDADLPPEDAKLARILNRITRLEDERNTAQRTLQERDAELFRLRERAKAAEEYDTAFSRFREDPEALFRKVGWDRKTIDDYLAKGPSQADSRTAALQREHEELKSRIAKFEEQDQKREQTVRIEAFKAALPAQFEAVADKYPRTAAYYDSPRELSDALFHVMSETYRGQGREPTVAEAATALESILGGHYERLTRTRSKGPAGTSPAHVDAPKPTVSPSTPTLTNTPPAPATRSISDSESDDDLLELAKQTLRKARAAA